MPAVIAATTNQTTAIEQGLITGAVPLTPIQHWFLAQNQPDAHYWNQSLLLEVAPGSNPDLWEQIVQHLLNHHDAGGKNTVAEANTVSVYLSQQETQALLQEVHQAYRTQINDVLQKLIRDSISSHKFIVIESSY
ncbi:condensation domain-containing protein [Synechocystis sp. PCC 7509]|uniref:condensation domain-containing protein n=1 Tax=Synechocystis sp. PCC 7509 TaxID=927677 RepID=UPI000491E567|nr:condensation domain-containing protein [Synechocystis sp. PCC 7509]